MPEGPGTTNDSRPLAGLRVVEVSSFVAAPLCGLTLSQLGAEVIRVDPIGGAGDKNRWPVTEAGESIYWAGLNRGKRSVTCDLRSPEGRELVRRLITAPGEGGGILVTNAGGRGWMSHETLSALRHDVITVQILGKRDGSAAVDYTVNAATGFPLITGSPSHDGPANHVLPAWDVACGLYAALAIAAAVRKREATGRGSAVDLPLSDVALAVAGHLSYLTEVQINGVEREATGNAVYGTYGKDFRTGDGTRFMVVALTPRHMRDLVRVTGRTEVVAALESTLGVDFSADADRYRYRELLDAVFATWFAEHTAAEVEAALSGTSVLFDRYRGFADIVASGELAANPLFSPLEQPRIGTYLAAGLPATFDGRHLSTGPAPALGADGAAVVRDLLGAPDEEIEALIDGGHLGASSR
ncbi:CoA transferase [Nocardia higoensis]|uniref:CoA transferase n=1 Tax=Nocardia higoensis TaxID=228599 RepID=A0ABS0DDQ6_9NOCA|nr:CoA transferase [Nocardia higoensis]MBF6355727.1 CoA transferase [Nocardia higoensis]